MIREILVRSVGLLVLPPMFLLLFLSTACRRHTLIPDNITREEYTIYEFALQDEIKDQGYDLIYITDSTFRTDPWHSRPGTLQVFSGDLNIDVDLNAMKLKSDDFRPEEFADVLKQSSRQSYQLKIDSLKCSAQYRATGRSGGGGAEQSKPRVSGRYFHIQFSRVAFSSAHDESVVYVEYFCGELCAWGGWLWLKRVNSEWTLHGQYMKWVS